MSGQRVLVCGAGPVGALAALYAATRGDEVHVFELRSDLLGTSIPSLRSAKSINLALSERGISALKSANVEGLLDDVLADTISMHSRMIHGKRKDGAIFQESQPYDARGRFIRAADRGNLNQAILAKLTTCSNVQFHYNHKLIRADFDQKVAWFEKRATCRGKSQRVRGDDNEQIQVSFDLLIGADGAHSATRHHLMKYARLDYAQEYIDMLWCEFRIEPTAQGTHAIDPHHLHIWPAGSLMFIAIPSSDASFTCTLFASNAHFQHLAADPERHLIPFFNDHFPGICDKLIPTSHLMHQFQANPHLPLISIKCAPYHYRDAGVILGDAAHAMVPFYGQGMNAGLEDVRILFEHLDRNGVYSKMLGPQEVMQARSEALSQYTETRKADAHAINDLAFLNYREMSNGVRSPLYKLRKWTEEWISVHVPWTGWRTQYVRVSFENQPYAQVCHDVARQGRILVCTFIAVLSSGACLGAYFAWKRAPWTSLRNFLAR